MRRQKPIQKLDVYGDLCNATEDAVGDSFYLKKNQVLLIKPPAETLKTGDIEWLALQNEVEHEKMLKLQNKLEDDKKRQAIVDVDRTAKMMHIMQSLQNKFIDLNQFFHINEQRRALASKIVTDNKQLHVELKEAKSKLHVDLKVLQELRDCLAKTVQEYEPYEKVMNEAIANYDYWESTQDCVVRCDALMLAQEEITNLKNSKFLEIESIRQNMVRLIKEAQIEIMGLNTSLTDCERNLTRSKDECLLWEKKLGRVKDCLVAKEYEEELLRDAIDTMYREICRHYAISHKHNTVSQKMNFIREEFKIISDTLRDCLAELNK